MITATALDVTERTWKDVRFTLDGISVHLQRHDMGRRWHPRVFLSGDAITPGWEHPPYGSTQGDGSDEDKAWKKYNREESRLQRELARKTLDALKAMGAMEWYGPDYLGFSRHAGCSCPCSPGLVWQADAFALPPLTQHQMRIGTIWIHADSMPD